MKKLMLVLILVLVAIGGYYWLSNSKTKQSTKGPIATKMKYAQQQQGFIEQVKRLERDAVLVKDDNTKIMKVYYGPNHEILYITKWTQESVLKPKPEFPITHGFLAYIGFQEGSLPSMAIQVLLPLEDSQKLPETLRIRNAQFAKIVKINEAELIAKDPDVIATTDYVLPANKINSYTEESFFNKVIVGNGFDTLQLKDRQIDFTSAQTAYPSLMVGAYLDRVYDDIDSTPDKAVGLSNARQDLEKALIYARKANTPTVNQIFKYDITRYINIITDIHTHNNSSLNDSDYKALQSLLEEYQGKV